MKTNALRILEQKKVPHECRDYPVDETKLDAVSVAEFLGMEPEKIFKTLVVKGQRTGPAVFCIPGNRELDLKSAAKAAGDKKIEMLPLKELQPLTGYIHGGLFTNRNEKELSFLSG